MGGARRAAAAAQGARRRSRWSTRSTSTLRRCTSASSALAELRRDAAEREAAAIRTGEQAVRDAERDAARHLG